MGDPDAEFAKRNKVKLTEKAVSTVKKRFNATATALEACKKGLADDQLTLSGGCAQFVGEIDKGATPFTVIWQASLTSSAEGSRLIATNTGRLHLDLSTLDEG